MDSGLAPFGAPGMTSRIMTERLRPITRALLSVSTNPD